MERIAAVLVGLAACGEAPARRETASHKTEDEPVVTDEPAEPAKPRVDAGAVDRVPSHFTGKSWDENGIKVIEAADPIWCTGLKLGSQYCYFAPADCTTYRSMVLEQAPTMPMTECSRFTAASCFGSTFVQTGVASLDCRLDMQECRTDRTSASTNANFSNVSFCFVVRMAK